MRLKDESREEGVRHLALGMLASSIFQWKLSLGRESVFTPAATAAHPLQIRDHNTHVFNPKSLSRGPKNRNAVAPVLDQRSGPVFPSIVRLAGGLDRPAEQSRTFSR